MLTSGSSVHKHMYVFISFCIAGSGAPSQRMYRSHWTQSIHCALSAARNPSGKKKMSISTGQNACGPTPWLSPQLQFSIWLLQYDSPPVDGAVPSTRPLCALGPVRESDPSTQSIPKYSSVYVHFFFYASFRVNIKLGSYLQLKPFHFLLLSLSFHSLLFFSFCPDQGFLYNIHVTDTVLTENTSTNKHLSLLLMNSNIEQ